MNFNWAYLWSWLQQPSTVKGIIDVVGGVGILADPTKITTIISAVLTVRALINIFYDQNPRKPSTQ